MTDPQARDHKGELGSDSQASPKWSAASEQRVDLKEAPKATEVSNKEALEKQIPIPAIESSPPPAPTVFGKNTA